MTGFRRNIAFSKRSRGVCDIQLYLRCFHSMFGGAGKVNTDEDLDVSQTEYDTGYTLYGFNLATNHEQVFEVSKRGSVRIDLKFDVALAQNVIVYAEYDNVIQIDSTRNVRPNYSKSNEQ